MSKRETKKKRVSKRGEVPGLNRALSKLNTKPAAVARFYLRQLTGLKPPKSSEELWQEVREYILVKTPLTPHDLDLLAEHVVEFRDLTDLLGMIYKTCEIYDAVTDEDGVIVSLRFLLRKLERYDGKEDPNQPDNLWVKLYQHTRAMLQDLRWQDLPQPILDFIIDAVDDEFGTEKSVALLRESEVDEDGVNFCPDTIRQLAKRADLLHEAIRQHPPPRFDPVEDCLNGEQPAQQSEGQSVESQESTEPKKLLTGWHKISKALNMPYDQRNGIKSLNKRFDGPITNRGPGTHPMVYEEELREWWDKLAAQEQELANKREGVRLSAKDQHDYGRDGTATPGIGGGVKKRRRDRRT